MGQHGKMYKLLHLTQDKRALREWRCTPVCLTTYCVTCFACVTPDSFYLVTFYLTGKWVNVQYGTQPHDTSLSLVYYKLYSYTI